MAGITFSKTIIARTEITKIILEHMPYDRSDIRCTCKHSKYYDECLVDKITELIENNYINA